MKNGNRRAPGRGSLGKRVALIVAAGAVLIVVALLAGYSAGGGGKETPIEVNDDAGTTAEAQVWTCSMHPQIRQPKPGKCPVCAMDLIPVADAALEATGGGELSLSPAARKLAEIQTSPAERRAVAAEIRMVGKVEYDETRVSYITAWVPGRLERLYVDYTGVSVKRGDPMVAVYSPELVAAQDELIQSLRAAERLKASDVESIRRTADETVGAVREKLRLWGLTGEQIAEVETRGTVSDTVVVRAPAGGVVVEKNAFEGQYVSTGTRIYTIADLSHVWVKLDAYESDLPWVRPGQRVAFSTDAYPGETFEGETAFIDPVLDPRTRTAKVRVNLENPGGKLKPEMFVHGTVEAEITPAAGGRLPLVIPASAPLITGKRAVVYVETDPGVYSGREILLGPRAGDFYVVEKGLEEGERVVTQGNFKIDSAVQILARPSMMNPEGEGALAGHVEGKPQTSTGSPLEVMGGLKDQLDKVFEAYLEVHHGLSSDSLEEAQTSARSVEEALRAVNAEPLNEPARSTWMTLKAGLSEAAGTIGAAGDIAEARAAFARLSQAMYETLRRFGTGTGVQAYRFYCQMAFDGEGAYWLQTTQDAENPYYGAAMLRCSAMSEPVVSAGVGPDGEQTDD